MNTKRPKQIQALLNTAMQQHQGGQLQHAQALYQQVLQHDPQQPQALHLLGVIAYQTQHYEQAIELIQRAIQHNRTQPQFYANLGNVYRAQGQLEAAIEAFSQAVKLKADFIPIWGELGNLLKEKGLLNQARACYQRIIQLKPNHEIALNNLGNVWQQQGELIEAERCYQQALAVNPDYFEAGNNLGVLLHQQGRLPAAAECYQQLLAKYPQRAEAHNNLGLILREQQHLELAKNCFLSALALNPAYAQAHYNLAMLYQQQQQWSQAQDCFQQALSHQPQYPQACHGLASLYYEQEQFDNAISWFQKALTLHADNPDYHNSLGVAWQQSGDWDQAMQCFEQAIQLKPEHDKAHFNRALSLLRQGDFPAGWLEYQWRPDRMYSTFKEPLPTTVKQKRLLLYKEQGLGDELFFLRFAPLLKTQGADFLGYCASDKIRSLLARQNELDQVISVDQPLPQVDHTLLIGDLPLLLIQLNEPTLPPSLTLSVLPQALKRMQQRLAQLGQPPYIGLTWRAGLKQVHAYKKLLSKEIHLTALAAALKPLNATWIGLQRQPHSAELATLTQLLKQPIYDLSALNDDLESMLALLYLLDDYVGVSNTNMHLRAALGKTAKVLVPYPPEWRWLEHGKTSVWFPGFNIYRQFSNRSWALEALRQDLLTQWTAYGLR